MSQDAKARAIVVSDLQYYFDAVERDSLDRQSHSHRSTQVLAIRDKLLTMPDKEFAAAVQTIKNILNPNLSQPTGSEEQKVKKQHAVDLYEKTRSDKPIAVLKAGSV